jgi:DNA invertase Pin-like site-specific DNA recombinase
MRVAIYVRVSTQRQAQAQTIEQQLDRLRAVIGDRGWGLLETHIFRDDVIAAPPCGDRGWTGCAISSQRAR